MKLLNKFLIPFAALSLAACSSMDVDDSEAVTENFPDDFSGAVYMELHPELVSLQVRNYIVNVNTEAKDDSLLTAEAIKADEEAFTADTAQLHKIYASPYYGGYGEERWQEAIAPVETMERKCKTQSRYTTVNLNQISGEDTTHIKLLDPITFVKDSTDTSKIVSVVGKSDSAATEVDTLVLSDTLVLLSGKNRGTAVVDTVSCDTTYNSTPGSINAQHVKFLMNFNFVNTTKDWEALKAIPIDTFAISLQYVFFGESHGWAYRKCKDSEKKNPVISEEYPVTKRYCADADGVVREIK